MNTKILMFLSVQKTSTITIKSLGKFYIKAPQGGSRRNSSCNYSLLGGRDFFSHYSIVWFFMFVLVEKLQLLLSLFYDAKNHLDIVGKDIYVYFKKNVKYAMSAEYSQKLVTKKC